MKRISIQYYTFFRYKIPDLDFNPKNCKHKGKQYECSKVTPLEIKHCKDKIYGTEGNKIFQDQRICHHMITKKPGRKRPRKGNVKGHSISIEYIVSIFYNTRFSWALVSVKLLRLTVPSLMEFLLSQK